MMLIIFRILILKDLTTNRSLGLSVEFGIAEQGINHQS